MVLKGKGLRSGRLRLGISLQGSKELHVHVYVYTHVIIIVFNVFIHLFMLFFLRIYVLIHLRT